jgi:hypothetical protein
MNLFDLPPQQLKRAPRSEKIDGLNKQLRGILVDGYHASCAAEKSDMSASVKKKIAATQGEGGPSFEFKPTVSARPAAKRP